MDQEELGAISVENLVSALENDKFLSNLQAAAYRQKEYSDRKVVLYGKERRQAKTGTEKRAYDIAYWESVSRGAACNQIFCGAGHLRKKGKKYD